MTSTEKRAAVSLASIYALRMLGLFMIMPVFAIYAEQLEYVTPVLIGLAIGIYGLTQALLQIPFGMLSDHIGRKPVIVAGLLLFALGSVIAAMADNIYWIIAGRAIQGSGAIAAAVMALLADLTTESHRTKAMATIGASIGMAFTAALVIGPILNEWIGVPGIFWLTAALAMGGVMIILFVVPAPDHLWLHRDAEPVAGQFGGVLRNVELLRLDFGIFVMHLVMTSFFLAFPLLLRDVGGIESGDHWKVYLPVLLLAVALMIPFVIIAEKRGKMKQIFLSAIILLIMSLAGIALLATGRWGLIAWLLLFFTAFNLLEATLPSLISKVAPVTSKGTAMGVYSTSQFAGAFAGGAAGGWVHHAFGLSAVFVFAALLVILWLLFALGMRPPAQLKTELINIRHLEEEHAQIRRMLLRIEGVREAVIVEDEGVAYLKVNSATLDRDKLEAVEALGASA
ncbi:MAG: MFS transporter [Pseudomonadota bacterium]